MQACFGLVRDGAGTHACNRPGTNHQLRAAAIRPATAKRFPATAERRAKCRAADGRPGSNRTTAERYGAADGRRDADQLPAAAGCLADSDTADPSFTANRPAAESGPYPGGPGTVKHLTGGTATVHIFADRSLEPEQHTNARATVDAAAAAIQLVQSVDYST